MRGGDAPPIRFAPARSARLAYQVVGQGPLVVGILPFAQNIETAYRGEFLPEDRYDDWTRGARDEARSRFVVAARRLAARSGPERAVGLARRLVEVDPYDEAAHRLLIDNLAELGDLAGAARAEEDFRKVF